MGLLLIHTVVVLYHTFTALQLQAPASFSQILALASRQEEEGHDLPQYAAQDLQAFSGQMIGLFFVAPLSLFAYFSSTTTTEILQWRNRTAEPTTTTFGFGPLRKAG